MAFELQSAIDHYAIGLYGNNAIALLAIALRFDIDDMSLVSNQALTDCSKDKKCDLIFIDDISRTAIIAQAYNALDTNKSEPPSNKASDLNTAIGWALSREISEIPEEIRPQVQEVRDGLATGRVATLEFWYIHNLVESKNADNELITVRESAKNALHTKFPDSACNANVLQVGMQTIEKWWNALQADVGIEESLAIPVFGAFVESGKDWSATVASVPALWLYQMFQKHGTDIFKGNVRDYLGLRESDANINRGIRNTVENEPGQLFVYNNGLSIITRKAKLTEDQTMIHIDGLSIVNGAQTTGSIGNAGAPPGVDARLLVRFIAVSTANRSLVQQIIRYNNSQNRVEAADFRSADDIQTRLRSEFAQEYTAVRYLGGRRGGQGDEIQRNRKNSQLIDSTDVAKSLAAFHGMPTMAYNRVKDLWADENYTQLFPREQITARHIVFVYSLYRAIAEAKRKLQATPSTEQTASGQQQLQLLKSTSAYFVLMAGIGQAIEMLAGRAVPSNFQLTFGKIADIDDLVSLWSGPVSASMPFMKKFNSVINEGLKSESEVKQSLGEFSSSLEALGDLLDDKLKEFRFNLDVRAPIPAP